MPRKDREFLGDWTRNFELRRRCPVCGSTWRNTKILGCDDCEVRLVPLIVRYEDEDEWRFFI